MRQAEIYRDADLRRLEGEYPDWNVWQSAGSPGAWYASRRLSAEEARAGMHATVAADTAAELERCLVEQARRDAQILGRDKEIPFTTGDHPL